MLKPVSGTASGTSRATRANIWLSVTTSAGIFQHHGNGVVVEDVADELHLRQDEPALGCFRIDGSDQHHGVAFPDDAA